LVVRTFRVPCAHAPALLPLPLDPLLAPKSAAEELGHTFLPCVLVGLSRAPQIVSQTVGQTVGQIGTQIGTQNPAQPSDIWANQVDALVVPATACGGSAVLSLSQSQTRLITVGSNTTRMQVTAASLGLPAIAVNSYLEALGALVAHRAGIDPTALDPQLHALQPLDKTLDGKANGKC